MITLDELYKKVMSDRSTMAEFVKASGTGTLSQFAGLHGCTATDEEIRRFFLIKCEGELTDEETEEVTGGQNGFNCWIEKVFRDKYVINKKSVD